MQSVRTWAWCIVFAAAGCSGLDDEHTVDQQATIKLAQPAITVVGRTASSVIVQVCAGPTGAKAGFSVQWTDESVATGWPDDSLICKGSFSGQANASRFSLAPGACTIVDMGRQQPEPGATVTCAEQLACATPVSFRSFAHAYSEGAGQTYVRSDFSANLGARTEACNAHAGLRLPRRIANALAQLPDPDVDVLDVTETGLVKHMVGDLGHAGDLDPDDTIADTQLHAALAPVVAPFQLDEAELHLRRAHSDDAANRHFRYNQVHNGLDVIGGDLIVHVDARGTIFEVNGTARGDLPPSAPLLPPGVVHNIVRDDPRWVTAPPQSERLVYLVTEDGDTFLAYEVLASGERGPDPASDKVYVDAMSGAIVAVYPQIHFAENRSAYNLNHGTSLPGTLVRSEGQAESSDIDINAAYDGTGAAWEAYKWFFNRDSYNNAGAALISSVHYSTNYCNAFWNSTQMVYGDGDPSQGCLPLARAVDVTAHELTHAVTENESGLVYSGESGGMNEAMSDIFGAFVEAFVDGGKTGTLLVSADTWLVGEDILPPALRWMCDPMMDGASKDLWTSTVGNVDVHYSSGVANLAFCLLSQGGHHPRNKTAVNVTGIGFDHAIRIFYKAQTDYLTATAKYFAVRTATEQAATALGYSQEERDSVSNAWAAVAVGTAVGQSPPPPPEPTVGVLVNGVPVTGLGDASGGEKYWTISVPAGTSTLSFVLSGGTGDADLYVKFGSMPTTSSYNCRPYVTGNNETCNFTPPQVGTYYVMLRGYTTYSGTSLKATYSGTIDPPTKAQVLTNGVPVTGLSGLSGSARYWRISVPAFSTLTVRISGGSGDADLYTRKGSLPTTTAYNCRPYLVGNNEVCTMSNLAAADVYIMVRAYAPYSGVTLFGSY